MEKWKTAALLLVSAFAAYYLLLGGSTSIPTVISIPAEGGVLQNGPYSLTGEQPHIVVVGSGPTGQGAAWRLFELGTHALLASSRWGNAGPCLCAR